MHTEVSGPVLAADVSGAPPILISLSAFGAAEVRRHGQLWFTQLSHAAGADGVEVRSELLVDPAVELPAIAQAVRAAGKRVVYSSADYLWAADGTLDEPALDRALAAAQTLGAPRLKMAIGGFAALLTLPTQASPHCKNACSSPESNSSSRTTRRRLPAPCPRYGIFLTQPMRMVFFWA